MQEDDRRAIAHQLEMRRLEAKNRPIDLPKRRSRWLSGYKSRFGIEPDAVTALLIASCGVCSICLRPFTPREPILDHCHDTGKVRTLLCNRCNSGLGMFQDDPARMRRAAKYVEHFKAAHKA